MNVEHGVAGGGNAAGDLQQKMEQLQAFVFHHIQDSHALPTPFGKFNLPGFITVHSVMLVLTVLMLILVFGVAFRRKTPVPHGFANLLEVFVAFIRNQIVVPFLGEEDGSRLTPLFCSFFFFILGMNIIGLVPSFSAPAANLSVTGALAIVTLVFMIFGGIYKNGIIGFFAGFVPHGIAWPIAVLLFPIEVLGLFIKAFALAIRLFANIMAGHMVIFFLVGMAVIFGLKGAPLLVMALFIYILEVVVAFLQAYIFTLLSAMFIGQRYHPEH
jgi:F-type H+-transporting ATPase subunit a